jgi:hypothetical protein
VASGLLGHRYTVMASGGHERDFTVYDGERFDAFEVIDQARLDLTDATRHVRR